MPRSFCQPSTTPPTHHLGAPLVLTPGQLKRFSHKQIFHCFQFYPLLHCFFNLSNIVSAKKPVVCSSNLPRPDGRRANPNKATAVLRFLLVVRRRSTFLSSFLSTSSFSLHQVCTSQNPPFVSLIYKLTHCINVTVPECIQCIESSSSVACYKLKKLTQFSIFCIYFI